MALALDLLRNFLFILLCGCDDVPPAADSRVDEILKEWHERASAIRSGFAVFHVTTTDAVWKKTEKRAGSARYLAPGMARLDLMNNDGRPDEGFILTGKRELWNYSIPKGQMTVYEGMSGDTSDELRALLVGIAVFGPLEDRRIDWWHRIYRVQDETAQWVIALAEETETSIRLEFRLPKPTKSSFWCRSSTERIEVTLDKRTMLPTRAAHISFDESKEIVEFDNIWTNIDIQETDFDPPPTEGFVVIRKQLEEDK